MNCAFAFAIVPCLLGRALGARRRVRRSSLSLLVLAVAERSRRRLVRLWHDRRAVDLLQRRQRNEPAPADAEHMPRLDQLVLELGW
jgi:hypothetical protein